MSQPRGFMFVLSVLAVFLAYESEREIANSNGLYRGDRLAYIGRTVGFGWGTVILFSILLGLATHGKP